MSRRRANLASQGSAFAVCDDTGGRRRLRRLGDDQAAQRETRRIAAHHEARCAGTRLAPITVWNWNGKRALWGTNTQAELAVALPGAGTPDRLVVPIENPSVWLSAVTFLGPATNVEPDSLIFQVVNRTSGSLRVEACRLWLPENNASWRALLPQAWRRNRLDRFPADGAIPANDRGGARIATGLLPLTYAALEVRLVDAAKKPMTLWAYQRIKREVFDISGGWVASNLGSSNTLHAEPYLRTLARMHINAAMHQHVPGDSDTPLFEKYPLKYMNRLQPFDRYDTDSMLPRIHAVEFLGEPQYGGGKPVPPQIGPRERTTIGRATVVEGEAPRHPMNSSSRPITPSPAGSEG